MAYIVEVLVSGEWIWADMQQHDNEQEANKILALNDDEGFDEPIWRVRKIS